MLFNFGGNIVDIVRESPYKGIYPVRSSSSESLRAFRKASGSEMLKVPLHLYPYMIHIGEDSLPYKIPIQIQADIEIVERLTPEPACFIYEYAKEKEGELIGGYGYCWPDEVKETSDRLMFCENPVEFEPIFLPIFRIPSELIGAVTKIPDVEIEFVCWDEIDENKPDNE